MMTEASRFPVFILASLAVFILILVYATRQRAVAPSYLKFAGLALLIVVGGMLFAKYGQNLGLPWWIYYPVPALLTVFMPPVVLRFTAREFWQYFILAGLSPLLIHVLFSFFLGWNEYMPFIPVPSLQALFGGG